MAGLFVVVGASRGGGTTARVRYRRYESSLARLVRDTPAVTTRTLLAAWLAGAPFEREAVRGVYFRDQSVAEVARLHAVSTADVGRAMRAMYRRIASFVLDEQVDTDVPAPVRATSHVLTLARLPVACWRWDTAGDAMTWSDAMYELYGYPVGAVGATIDRHMAHKELDDRRAVEGLIVAGATERGPVVFPQRIIRTDGTWCRVIMRVNREPGAREVLTGRAVVDI